MLTLSLVVRKVSLIAISPNVRRLLITVLEVFEAFQQTALGYAPTCKTNCLQILCKFCKNWISVPNIVHHLTLSLRCKYSRSNFPDVINSRLYAAWPRSTARQWRQSSTTSFVLNPRTLERAYWRPFLTVFWGIWTPKCRRPSCGPQKGTSLRHNPCFEPSPVKFDARVTAVSESGEKIKIKKRGLIFHVFRQALPYGRLAQVLGYLFVS